MIFAFLLEGLHPGRLWHWLISWGVTGTFFTLLRYVAADDNNSDNDMELLQS